MVAGWMRSLKRYWAPVKALAKVVTGNGHQQKQ
jgi:hypothetical protein